MPLFAALGPIITGIGSAAGAVGGALGGVSGISGLAGLGSSIYGAVNSSNAVNASTKAQLAAAQQAEADLQPWMYGGQSALAEQMKLLGLGGGGGDFGQPNYAAYVQNNPDLLAAYQSQQGLARGKSMEQFGQEHWQGYGQGENRPFTPFGTPGATGSAASAQQAAIDQLKQSPMYQSLFHNGEQTVLADAAATGGLRGGNANRSLYNVGVDTLASVIQQQLQNLNTISSNGENAAAKVGNTQFLGGQIAGSGATSAANANDYLAKTIAGSVSNPSLLNLFGLGGGGGGIATTPFTQQTLSLPGSSVAPLNLDTSLPQLSF